ncbi:type I restriction enzyme HsdR N-terminal domain-containing protein [Pseudovibrio sp. Tun.PSC04-5.I4]|uniref:type I restriction enzyme HsdR N-terminal domain-containing protein n=1 Tax=Pseudovibrio sp. Tun.PSC04-5.I4 TaxID=1798213 RepID=UPI00087F973E|nr:type I restriction enzyme HsdR N-terminal domain-containing protein [Pseudovibrio sp. Tun.PSC04-5.I4]SDR39831.1 Type I restriction enzyme R protein N terminus (HSDR_N) [Pseudovibrio sp. Tun.PSC04-5.I4]
MTIVIPAVLQKTHSYNEAKVRYQVIDPIMRKLGYDDGGETYIELEEELAYPYFHIGHKSKKKDLPLGFPDYRAGLKGRRGSFVVEAKAAKVGISAEDVEQAHSYAAHALVGANYFVLCDGNTFVVYETLSGPNSSPIINIPLTEIDARFHEIENILAPESLAKNCQVSYDLNLKLCEGLRSSAELRSGEYEIDEWSFHIYQNGIDKTEDFKKCAPQFQDIDVQMNQLRSDFNLKIEEGTLQRDRTGRISAHVSFMGATKNNLSAMKQLGINTLTFATKDEFLSLDRTQPTVFETTADFSLEHGTMFPQLLGSAVPIDTDLEGDTHTVAYLFKEADAVLGDYISTAVYRVPQLASLGLKLELKFQGRILIRLAP